VAQWIEMAGGRVETAAGGEEALQAVARTGSTGAAYDAILMDLHMPGMDGLETTRRLRRQGYSGRIIALTADLMAAARKAAFEAGCDEFIGKPVNPKRLLERIRAAGAVAAS
jgi:CheY-like chemotaxis protein